jgi:peptidoglycan/LPS O-acetylase OafA/YrhL
VYYVDWLRVLAILAIFLFHSSRFFNRADDWHVRNATSALAPTILVSTLVLWIMPLFTALAGMGAYYALGFRGAWGFLRERVMRLVVPLAIGIFVLAPPIVYLERLSHRAFFGSFWQFIPRYFDGMYMDVGEGGNFAWQGLHLWFLLVLFLISLIALPLIVRSRGNGRSLASRVAPLFSKPWSILLLALPIAAIMVASDELGPLGEEITGWPLLSYLFFFLGGYVVASHTRIEEMITRYRWVLMAMAIAITVCGFALWGVYFNDGIADGSLQESGLMLLLSVNAWCWILGLLGLARRFLNRPHRVLVYSGEAVLPFYILHQPIILAIGYFVVQWDMSITAKYAIIAPTSFIAIMGVYELLVRRLGVMRFLFGMKAGRKHVPQPLTAAKAPSLAGNTPD